MNQVSLTGDDTIIISGRMLTTLADGDCVTLTWPNESASMSIGKDGNTAYARNAQGSQVDATVRVLRGSADDRWFERHLASTNSTHGSFSSQILLTGSFIKHIGDGLSNVIADATTCEGGVILKPGDAKTNAAGDTEQSIIVWSLRFARHNRTIG